MNIFEKLLQVQSTLKCPKNQYNSFGKYNYRNCEDILESLKPALKESNCIIVLSDEVQEIGNRFYIKATAKFIDVESGQHIENTALAREEENKKGADGSQITGASSSYARKYALNGLFAIDDNKDSDVTNTHGKTENNSNNVTESQLKLLHSKIKEKNYSIEDLKKFVMSKFNKTSTKDLTQSEFKIVLEQINKH